jgi:hypothetical protein
MAAAVAAADPATVGLLLLLLRDLRFVLPQKKMFSVICDL